MKPLLLILLLLVVLLLASCYNLRGSKNIKDVVDNGSINIDGTYNDDDNRDDYYRNIIAKHIDDIDDYDDATSSNNDPNAEIINKVQ